MYARNAKRFIKAPPFSSVDHTGEIVPNTRSPGVTQSGRVPILIRRFVSHVRLVHLPGEL